MFGFPLWSAGASAQSAPVPKTPGAIENTNALYVPTDETMPEADPARPTVTIPARLPPTGYLQLENGVNEANASPAGTGRQMAVNQTTKLALTTRLMVQFLSQPYTFDVLHTPGVQGHTSSNDSGDLILGGQIVLHKAVGPLPTVSLVYNHRMRAGTAANLDVGDSTQAGLVLMSGDLRGGFHYDANLGVLEQTSGPVRRAQYQQSFDVQHLIFNRATGGRLLAGGELSHFTQPLVTADVAGRPLATANTLGMLWFTYFTIRPNLVMDAAFDHGLTSSSTQWQGTMGVTYVLPHRLWPDRHPRALPVGPYRYGEPGATPRP